MNEISAVIKGSSLPLFPPCEDTRRHSLQPEWQHSPPALGQADRLSADFQSPELGMAFVTASLAD